MYLAMATRVALLNIFLFARNIILYNEFFFVSRIACVYKHARPHAQIHT